MASFNHLALVLAASFVVSAFATADLSPAPAPAPSLDDIPAPADKPRTLPKEEIDQISNFLKSQIEGASHKINIFTEDVIDPKLADESTDPDSKDCLGLCKQINKDVLNDLLDAGNAINADNWEAVKFGFTSFAKDFDTCKDCFVEMEKNDQKIMDMEMWAKDLSTVCLGTVDRVINN